MAELWTKTWTGRLIYGPNWSVALKWVLKKLKNHWAMLCCIAQSCKVSRDCKTAQKVAIQPHNCLGMSSGNPLKGLQKTVQKQWPAIRGKIPRMGFLPFCLPGWILTGGKISWEGTGHNEPQITERAGCNVTLGEHFTPSIKLPFLLQWLFAGIRKQGHSNTCFPGPGGKPQRAQSNAGLKGSRPFKPCFLLPWKAQSHLNHLNWVGSSLGLGCFLWRAGKQVNPCFLLFTNHHKPRWIAPKFIVVWPSSVHKP